MSTGSTYTDDRFDTYSQPFSKRSLQFQGAENAATIWMIGVVPLGLMAIIAWPGIYILWLAFGIASTIQFFKFHEKNTPVSNLLIAKISMIGVLLLYHNNIQSFLNLTSILLCDISVIVYLALSPSDLSFFRVILKRFRVFITVSTVIGLILSTLLASQFLLDNPFQDALEGGRVRIYSHRFGHSTFQDFGIIILLICSSNILRESIIIRCFWLIISIIVIYFSRSSIGYIAFAAILYVFFVEHIPMRFITKNIIHVFIFAAVVTIGPRFSDDVLFYLRDFQTGGTVGTTYRSGDLTAGRATLNRELVTTAIQNPLFGAGPSDQILQEGIVSNSKVIAKSESPLRIAAKYGWIYFSIILLIVMSPITALLTRSRELRIFSLSLSLYILDVFAFNSVFELGHTWQTYVYLPLTLLTTQVCIALWKSYRPARMVVA